VILKTARETLDRRYEEIIRAVSLKVWNCCCFSWKR